MKLRIVHTYQTVRFNKKDETHFTADKPGMEDLHMSYDERGFVRMTKPGCDTVIVFNTNVAYAVPAEEKKFK